MKIDFRQGIVSYPSNNGQAFLQATGGGTDVNILTGSGFTTVAFAHRTTDYLYVETNPVTSPSAWSGLPGSGDTWLFWDINPQTAIVTYGFTIVEPTSGAVQPGTGSPITTPLVSDLHWFDTSENIMKVYDGTQFAERIRVFAARINGTSFFPMGTNLAQPFAGTQVGINSTVNVGTILFSQGLPVNTVVPGSFSPTSSNPFERTVLFSTTETDFLVGGSQTVSNIRLESDVVIAQASINMSAYDVVKYTSFGVIAPADYNDTESATIGILLNDVLLGETVSLAAQGIILNESWNWPTVGVELFIQDGGGLTASDPNIAAPVTHPTSKVPVARVVSATEIIFMQGLGKVGSRGLNPASIDSIDDVTIVGAVFPQVLKYSGSPLRWRNDLVALNEISNVEGSPTIGQALIYSGSPLRWRPGVPTIVELNDIQNVTITGRAPGDIMYYTGSPGWVNLARGTAGQVLTMGSPLIPTWSSSAAGSPAGSPETFAFTQLSDVTITSDSLGDVVYFDGTNWINLARGTAGQVLTMGSPFGAPSWVNTVTGSPETLALTQLSDVTLTGTTIGDVLYFAGSPAVWVNLARGTAGQVLTMGSPFGAPSWVDTGSPLSFPDQIIDADGDTIIQVEETADEDIIRFDTGDNVVGYPAQANALIFSSGQFTLALPTANVAATVGAAISLTGGVGNTTSAGGALNITAGAGGATGDGGAATIAGGAAGAGGYDGGAVVITGGAETYAGGPYTGGPINIDGGIGYYGGPVTIDGGVGTYYGGDANLTGGAGPYGGDVTIAGGSATGTNYGGDVTIQGGGTTSTGYGGSVLIRGGGLNSVSAAGLGILTLQGGGSSNPALPGQIAILEGGTGNATTTGGAVFVRGGAPGLTNGIGGSVSMYGRAGDGSSAGGTASVYGGAGQLNTAGNGSALTIGGGSAGAGTGTGTGGNTVIISGAGGGTSGDAGDITLIPGTAVGDGGDLILISGAGGPTGTGGDIILEIGLSGSPITTGNSGNVFINTRTGIGFTGGSVEATGSPITPGKVSIYGVNIAAGTNGKAGNVEIWGGYADGTVPGTEGGDLMLFGGGGGGSSADGGDAMLLGGDADRNGGCAEVIGGASTISGTGGDACLTGGESEVSGPGGNANITGGAGGNTGAGGTVTITGGATGPNATVNAGGDVNIIGGPSGNPSDGDGGNVTLTSGAGNGTGVTGDIILSIGGPAGSPLIPAFEAMRFAGEGAGGSPNQFEGVVISNQTAVGLTADTGSAQGDGIITSSYNVYSTVGAPGDAATLPNTFPVGTRIWIKNDGANSMDIFPASGDDLGQGANTPVALSLGSPVETGPTALFLATAASATWTQLI